MFKLLVFIILILPLTVHSKDFSAAENKTLKIAKALQSFYQKGSLNLKEIKKYKNKQVVVRSINCEEVNINLPNGNQEIGTSCKAGLGSGIKIDFDAKLQPIKISYFEP